MPQGASVRGPVCGCDVTVASMRTRSHPPLSERSQPGSCAGTLAGEVDAQFRILGPIEVDLAGNASGRVPRGRTLSFLALLLVHRGEIVHVDRVVDELWEGAGPKDARHAVHVVASRLRGVLGDGVVVSKGGGYAVRLAPGDLDAERFEGLFRRGRAELAQGEAREAAATLRQALAIWRGPALADVSEERFAQPEIARLEDLRIACLGDRVDADLACGLHAELAGELEGLVREHPLHERLRGQQMLALYRAGRQADALAAYRSAYRELADGLGIEPSPELRALEAAILRQEVPSPSSLPPAQGTPRGVDVRRLVTCVFAQLSDSREGIGPRPRIHAQGAGPLPRHRPRGLRASRRHRHRTAE